MSAQHLSLLPASRPVSSASSIASSASAMARSQKAAATAAARAQKTAEKEAAKAAKAAEREAIRAQKAAQKEYEKAVKAAEREAIKAQKAAEKAAIPKRPRGRPRKNPVTGSVASGSTASRIDAPVLTPPPSGLVLCGPRQEDDGDLLVRLAALEAAYADVNRRLQAIEATA